MGGPWEKYGTQPEPQADGPWAKYAPKEAAPDNWQPTKFGFKVRDTQDPETGQPTKEREDGAVWDQSKGWKQKDPQTGLWAPAPSEPWANKGTASRLFGSDAFKNLGRQASEGLQGAGRAFGGLVHDAMNATGLQSDKSYLEGIQQRDEADRQALAIKNTGGFGAGFVQGEGAAIPNLAAMALMKRPIPTGPTAFASASEMAPTLTPFAQRAAAEAFPIGGATYAMTPGTMEQRRNAALTGMVAAPLVMGGANVAGKVVRGLQATGQTPAAQELLDSIGARFGNENPGVALQNAAKAKYNEAWEAAKGAYGPPDAAAQSAPVAFTKATDELNQILGKAETQISPVHPEQLSYLTALRDRITKATAGAEGGPVADFQSAAQAVKDIGSMGRALAQTHGSVIDREALDRVRDAILQDMADAHPGASAAEAEGRRVFREQVVPLFDKKQGGSVLSQIRDSQTPNDLLAAKSQGSLTRMKADQAAIIAKGSSPDPLLYSYLDAALSQADGKPGSFVNSLNKAMPAVEKIADPETLKAFQGVLKVAKTAKWGGALANAGAGATVGGIPGAATSLGIGAAFNPAYSGPGLTWRLLQNPTTRKLLTMAAKLPQGSPALESVAAKLAATEAATQAEASNVSTLVTRPPQAAQNTDQ